MRRGEEAIQHYKEVLRVDPMYAQAHVHWGVALRNAGQRAAAVGHYRMALALDATCVDAHIRWANLLVHALPLSLSLSLSQLHQLIAAKIQAHRRSGVYRTYIALVLDRSWVNQG
jgi:tetratricopeptide (TPR) repeat protein